MTFITNKIKLIKFMKKKEYERPTMEVVEVKQQAQLLAGSMTGERDNPYGDPTDPWSE